MKPPTPLYESHQNLLPSPEKQISFWGDKNILEWNCGNGYATL